jgi:hypothetical protein
MKMAINYLDTREFKATRTSEPSLSGPTPKKSPIRRFLMVLSALNDQHFTKKKRLWAKYPKAH